MGTTTLTDLVERFALQAQSLTQGGQYKETPVRREYVDPLFKLLGWDIDNENGYAEPYKDVIHEDSVEVEGRTKAPDYAFRVGGLRWWRRVILPGIFPYFVTGVITASGGAWNAAIVSEVASWGATRLHASGLGSYIADATAAGNTPRVVLGVVVMSGFVVVCNRFCWRPLYAYSTRRLTL